MSILVVDDDPTIRDLATLLLTQAGFTHVTAVDGPPQAFKLLGLEPSGTAQITPDVILMDIMMPGINGIEACAHIKLDPRYADVPVLMVTTLSDVEHLKKAFLAGATDYMTKPIRAEELLARVRSAHRLKSELNRRKQREAELSAIAQQTLSPPSSRADVTDATTGLPGEGALLNRLGWVLDNAHSGVLVALGVDAWESFHTRYGQEKAEQAVAKIADGLSRVPAQLGDCWVRLDEARFAVFFPHKDASEAVACGNALRTAVMGLKIPHAFSPIGPSVTVSTGIVPLQGWPHSRADLLAEALTALATAQNSGGNTGIVIKAKGK